MNQFWQRIFGLFGIVGGIVLFTGDMLFYYHAENTNLLNNMANASDYRIKGSAVTALIAAWFYMIGLGQVYYAFRPAKPILRNIVLFSFGSILIAYGVVHGAYTAIATTAKLSMQNNLDIERSTELARQTNDLLRLFVYPFFAICSLVFITQVWKNKTLYPRWIILFFPLIPFLIQGVIGSILTGKTWVVVMGGYLNLILVVFFTASTVALWNVKTDS